MTKRLDEIDILKSIGIILMIMGHIGFGGIFDYYIHAFHMPMFFMISGFLYKVSNLSCIDFIKKKAKSLIIPYILFSLFHYFIWIFIQLIKDSVNVNLLLPLHSIFLINTDGMPIAGALWFLTALFFCECIYYFIDKIKNLKVRYFCIFILILLGYTIPFYFRLPFALDVSFIGIGLFEIGAVFKKKYNTDQKNCLFLLYLIIGSLLIFFNGYINMREGCYSNLLLFYLVSSSITYGLFYLSRYIKKYHHFVINELKFIGRNSLVYVCLNQIVLLIPNKISLLIHNIFFLLCYRIILLLISLIILHIFVIILNKKHFHWILGK